MKPARQTLGGMAAMIGGQENDVGDSLRTKMSISPILIAGTNRNFRRLAKVETAVGVAKEYGIRRATMLNVAGAYHSRLMESAYSKLGDALLDVEMQLPQFPVISNVTGEEADTLPEIRRHYKSR